MERAGRSLSKLKLSGAVTNEQLACAAWPAAVGERIAKHGAPKSLVRDTLIIEVEDPVWRKQLYFLRYQILEKLNQVIGEGIIRDVEFRSVAPRRPPQPAQQLDAVAPLDEADGIQDSGMRIVYRKAKKRASA